MKTSSSTEAGQCQQHADDVDNGGQPMPPVDDDNERTGKGGNEYLVGETDGISQHSPLARCID